MDTLTLSTGDEVVIMAGPDKGKTAVVFLPLRIGAEVLLGRERRWHPWADLQALITVS